MKWIICALALIALPASALTFTTEDNPPFNFLKDGKITGSSTDVLKEVMKRSRLTASFTLYPWARAYNMALTDKNTCVYTTARTEAREKLFKWVGPLVSDNWVLYAKSDSNISARTLDELKKYKVAGYLDDAKSIFLKSKGFTIFEAPSDEQNIKNLDAGRIDLWAASSKVGAWRAKINGVKVKPIISFKEVEFYAACNPSIPDADINKMNAAIKAIQADGTLDRISKTYR